MAKETYVLKNLTLRWRPRETCMLARFSECVRLPILSPTSRIARSRARQESRGRAGTVRRVVVIGVPVPCLVALATQAHALRCQDPCVRARVCVCL